MPLCKPCLAQPTADYVFFRGKILSTPVGTYGRGIKIKIDSLSAQQQHRYQRLQIVQHLFLY